MNCEVNRHKYGYSGIEKNYVKFFNRVIANSPC